MATFASGLAAHHKAVMALEDENAVTEEASVPEPLRHAASVVIEAPVEAVWAYVGDSRRATEWSVYFDHISPLPESPVPDGQPGALRRCFRRADETGIMWDEEVVAVVPERYREIRTYALRRFRPVMQPVAAISEYRVAQHYERLGAARTRLTFSMALARPGLAVARLAFRAFARDVVRVFRLNLENIKAAVEARHRGVPYRRPHPYEPTHPWD